MKVVGLSYAVVGTHGISALVLLLTPFMHAVLCRAVLCCADHAGAT